MTTTDAAFDDWLAKRAPQVESLDPILTNVLYAAFREGWSQGWDSGFHEGVDSALASGMQPGDQ